MKEIKIKCNECSEDGINATFLVIRPSLEHNGIPSRYVGVTIYDVNNRTIYGVALNEDQGNGLVHFLQSNEGSTYNVYIDGNISVIASRNETVTFTVLITNPNLDRTYTLSLI